MSEHLAGAYVGDKAGLDALPVGTVIRTLPRHDRHWFGTEFVFERTVAGWRSPGFVTEMSFDAECLASSTGAIVLDVAEPAISASVTDEAVLDLLDDIRGTVEQVSGAVVMVRMDWLQRIEEVLTRQADEIAQLREDNDRLDQDNAAVFAQLDIELERFAA